MRIEVGPVPSESTLAYVALSRERLDALRRDPGALSAALTPEVLDTFRDYLDQWEWAARADEQTTWVVELPAERVEYIVYAFFLTVQAMVERYGVEDPPGHELRAPFRTALVTALLEALTTDPDVDQDRVQYMLENWPAPGL